jgi:uncharacterized protein (TIGR03083 family)
LLRQRRRLGAMLASLDADGWAAPSRCEGWSAQDVVAHLVTTNQFWALSIGAGLAGEPTRFLATFDPVASPAKMVERVRHLAPAEVLDQYLTSVDEMATVVTDLDQAGWAKIGEAPPGHVALRAVALHALWDAWVHERDIALPLGIAPEIEADEIGGCLRYGAALGPAFSRTAGDTRTGQLAVRTTAPDLAFVVDVGDVVVVTDGTATAGTPTLSGDAVTVLEGLSFRVPLEHHLGVDDAWLVAGLDEVFDRV